MRRIPVHHHRTAWLLIATASVLALFAAKPKLHAAEPLSVPRDKLHSAYTEQLAELAKWCDANALPRQAELVRRWLPKRDPSMIYVFTLPQTSTAPATLVESPAGHQWWERFTALRRAQADELLELAESALKAKQPALAYELVREVVRENPDHERGRKILGFERYEDRWARPDAIRRLRSGQVWSDEFGWLPADHLSRYRRGRRFNRGQWIEEADDARLHSNIRNGWRVESEHYAVITNHSLPEGVRLSLQLEKLYDVWRQTFLGYFATSAQVDQWFSAGPASTAGAPRKVHQVVHFRDKQQYVDALRPVHPQIDRSLGFYSDSNRSAYLFAGDEQSAKTIFHEGTHQLFQEMRATSPQPGRKNNFWIHEALACYMESLTEHRPLDGEDYGSYVTIGGENEGRVPAARKRLLDDHFYVPFAELAAAGMTEMQSDSRLPQIYSQISGQALFLMHADAARYRGALLDFLIAVYTGKANIGTLEKLTGVKYEELDRQYREFLK